MDVLITFSIIYILGLVLHLIMWPDSFVASIDTFITFAYSIRFIPFYWHHIFTGCVYGGMMQVFPYPIAILILQWLFFTSVLGYLFLRIKNCTRINSKARFLVLFLLFTPESLRLETDPYRNSLYAILCLFFFTKVLFDVLDRRDVNTVELLQTLALGAFVALWRSEGIVLGILGIIIYLCVGCRNFHWKKRIMFFLCFSLITFVFSIPQSLGEEKYYGNDYLVVSTMKPLNLIFNDPDRNLSYSGATEDIQAIDAVVKVEYITKWGLNGMWVNNREQGREDIDQTFATDEERTAYVKAVARIILHNPKTYLIGQTNFFMKSIGIKNMIPEPLYLGGDEYSINVSLRMWAQGSTDYFTIPGTYAWEINPKRQAVLGTIYENQKIFKRNFGDAYGVVLHILDIVLAVYVFIREIVAVVKKDYSKMIFGLLAMLWLGELGIIFLTMPYSYSIYVYPFMTFMYMMLPIYFFVKRKKQN